MYCASSTVVWKPFRKGYMLLTDVHLIKTCWLFQLDDIKCNFLLKLLFNNDMVLKLIGINITRAIY